MKKKQSQRKNVDCSDSKEGIGMQTEITKLETGAIGCQTLLRAIFCNRELAVKRVGEKVYLRF